MKIIIHTESYAGNFERELCAYITGQVGDCGKGKNIESPSNHLNWWETNISIRNTSDDSDYTCYRPCSIHATPNWFNNGMGGEYRDIPENHIIAQEDLYQATMKYYQRYIDQHRQAIADSHYPLNWTKELREETILRHEESIEHSRNHMTKWPAYLSVAIFVDRHPSDEIMAEVEMLAREFANNPPVSYQKPFLVTSVELIEE